MADVITPPPTTKTRMSWEEFLAAGEEWQSWELVDGEVEFTRMSPAGFRHGSVIIRLSMQIGLYCQNHPEWLAVGTDTAFTMVSGNWRCPDAALVRAERFPGRKIPTGPAQFPPDVAFEVYSPGDTAAQIARKRRDYQESGVIQVWIDAEKRLVELVEPGRPPQYFEPGRPLVIDRLTDFALDLQALFEV
jgi:Uma2 family endonuclease